MVRSSDVNGNATSAEDKEHAEFDVAQRGTLESESELDSSESEDGEDTGLTENQNRLLYLISVYTHKADSAEDKDTWIRKGALLVLIYEGIVANVLDYDYAPASECIENRRVWLNISQEGKSDVEFLREEELVNGLQLSSTSFKPVTCYQISEKGSELVKRISRKDKEATHEFCYAKGSRELLEAVWDGRFYSLRSTSGYKRISTITQTEDVSYVSSAYVPQCLRYGGRPTLSNAHRAHESAVNTDSIRDELDEVISLNSVSILVAEYVPFGANQIVQLNSNVGSTERVQGGYVSPAVDKHASETTLELSPEMTAVDILDYTLTNHINFEAEIRFAEASGVVQVETFGVSLNAEGTCFYGMQVEAVMDRIKDNISLDHLARLLVDVQQDSSSIVDSIISQYQRDLLNLIFLGDASNRNKVNLIIANEITPHLTADEYMDKGEYENEFKQVIGDTKAAYDISEHDTLVFGAHGLLVAGPNSRHHEPLLCAYLQFITIDVFVQNFFARLWILNDDMHKTYVIIEECGDRDPSALKRIRRRICKLGHDIIMLEEILGYLLEALDIIEIPPEPPEQAGRALYERLEISGMRSQLVRRTTDLKKNVGGASRYLEVLREMTTVLQEDRIFAISCKQETNTTRLVELQANNEKTALLLQLLVATFAGILAFAFLDRVTGSWSVVNVAYMARLVEVMKLPFAWFGISIAFWVFFGFGLLKYFEFLAFKAQGLTTIQLRFEKRIVTERLFELVSTKHYSYEQRTISAEGFEIVTFTYQEMNWGPGNGKPLVTVEFDITNSFLLNVRISYNRRAAKNKMLTFNARDLQQRLMDEFNIMSIWDMQSEDHSDTALAIDKRAAIEVDSQNDKDTPRA